MPCSDAMVTNVISAHPDQTVAEAMAMFYKHKVRGIPVIDTNNKVVGLFDFHDLLLSILPVPGNMKGGHGIKSMDLSLDHIAGTTPWVERRLKLMMPKPLSEVMRTDFGTVMPDTPLREGIRMMVKYGSPVPIVKDDNNELVGLISTQTAIKSLIDLKA